MTGKLHLKAFLTCNGQVREQDAVFVAICCSDKNSFKDFFKTCVHFIPDDWEIPFEGISDLQWLGSGAQGAVFVGKFNHEFVAVKKVQHSADTNILHLRKLNHPNIVQFRGVCTQAPVFCVVMEYCPYGPLFNYLREGSERVPPVKLVEWTKQIASGVKYLHDHKIIHRDLKSPK